MNEELKPVLARLVEARKPKFNQAKAAQALGLASQQALSRIEHGKRELTVELLLRMCRVYDIAPCWALTGETYG